MIRMAGSEASMSMSGGEEAQLRELIRSEAGENRSNMSTEDPVKRRNRWTFLLKKKGEDDGNGNTKFKALTVSCRCKGAIKGSCLILSASFIELLGNLIALVYGVTYVLKAAEFYELDSDPDTRDKEYDSQLQHVLFLEKNGAGFIGLLAICAVGMIVAFMMPIGTIYKSWKCIRASMSLLLAMKLFHILLLLIYLSDTQLTYTAFAIPFRMYEHFLLHSYIQYYKKKKLEETKSGKRRMCNPPPGSRMSQLSQEDCIDAGSLISIDQQQQLRNAKIEKKSSDVQVTFDIKEGTVARGKLGAGVPDTSMLVDGVPVDGEPGLRKSKRKNPGIFRAWQRQSAKANNNKDKVQVPTKAAEQLFEYK